MTYPTCRYPTHLIDVVQLVEGTRVVIRPALPQDSDLQRAFVRNLSDEARYFRFMTRLSELPQAMAERFSTIDYQSHIALIAEISTGSGEIMIGEARYILDEGDATACEFAVAVADDRRGVGFGRILLERLVGHAALSGIRRMSGDTISTNKAMIALAKRMGFVVMQKREDGRLVHLVKSLPSRDRRTSTSGRTLGELVVAA